MPTLGQVAAWEYLHLQQAKVEILTFVLEHSSHKQKERPNLKNESGGKRAGGEAEL